MTEKKTLYRIIALAFAVILLLLHNAGLSFAFAETVEDFESRDVLTDLYEANVVNADKTGFTKQFADDNKNSLKSDVTIVYLVEYCYGIDDAYTLYTYVYKNKETVDDFSIVVDSAFNTVSMAVSFDHNGNPCDYETFNLTYLNQNNIDTGTLFKFKVSRTSRAGTDIKNCVTPITRTYAISGIQLKTSVKTQDFNVEKRWSFSGQALGITDKDNNELKCNVDYIPTISLDVNSTYYRTADHVDYVYDQISSVYFTIPNEYLESYGTLQRIKAEWYEYKTTPIVVTSNADFYNWFVNNNLAGRNYERESADADSYGLDWGVRIDIANGGDSFHFIDYNFGTQKSFFYPYGVRQDTLTTINWVLSFGGLNNQEFDEYSPHASSVAGNVSSSLVEAYMKNPLFKAWTTTDKTFTSSDGKEYSFPDKLFLNEIDSDRQGIKNDHGSIGYGYSYYDFDIDEDIGNVLTYNPDNASASELIKKYGFWKALFGKKDVETKEYAPFVPIKYEYIQNLDSTSVVDNYLINIDDVDNIKAAAKKAMEEDGALYLFRFANTDYYSSPAIIWDFPLIDNNPDFIANQAYVCQQTVFLNFDILQLTFKSSCGTYTVIGVVQDPINIIGDLTPPTVKDGTDLSGIERLLALLLGLIALIVVVWLLSKIFPPLATVAISVATMPINFIKNLFKRRK